MFRALREWFKPSENESPLKRFAVVWVTSMLSLTIFGLIASVGVGFVYLLHSVLSKTLPEALSLTLTVMVIISTVLAGFYALTTPKREEVQ